MRILFLILVLFVSACGKPGEKDLSKDLRVKPASFSDLPGWGGDDYTSFGIAFQQSCNRILKQAPGKAFGALDVAGTYGDWQGVCRNFQSMRALSNEAIRRFAEENLKPVQILAGPDEEGLFTGYYEASLKGSPVQTPRYNTPLHALPGDLVMVDLGAFREDLKGRRIAGRVKGNRLYPYENREEISAGQWPHDDEVLVWVDSPVDAFFLHIQGSGRVEFEGGTTMRVGYAGQNGHPYYAIGRELIKRGVLEKDQVSMQSIRTYLEENPAQAQEIMNTNASYVFFQKLDEAGPLGGEGVVLTPGRSLAVDRSLLSYGLPIWVDIEAPPAGGEGETHMRLRQLMVAQDTGGAIRGPVRGDVFWGYGDRAEALAGAMKSKGRYWALIPRHLLEAQE